MLQLSNWTAASAAAVGDGVNTNSTSNSAESSTRCPGAAKGHVTRMALEPDRLDRSHRANSAPREPLSVGCFTVVLVCEYSASSPWADESAASCNVSVPCVGRFATFGKPSVLLALWNRTPKVAFELLGTVLVWTVSACLQRSEVQPRRTSTATMPRGN